MTGDEARRLTQIARGEDTIEDLILKTNSSIRFSAEDGRNYFNSNTMSWVHVLKLKSYYKNAGFIVSAYKSKDGYSPYLTGYLNIRW